MRMSEVGTRQSKLGLCPSKIVGILSGADRSGRARTGVGGHNWEVKPGEIPVTVWVLCNLTYAQNRPKEGVEDPVGGTGIVECCGMI